MVAIIENELKTYVITFSTLTVSAFNDSLLSLASLYSIQKPRPDQREEDIPGTVNLEPILVGTQFSWDPF